MISTPSLAAACAVSAKAGTVTSQEARDERSWPAISPVVHIGLRVVTAPPAEVAPWNTTGYSGMFGARMARTLPRPNPRPASPAANDPTAPASCA